MHLRKGAQNDRHGVSQAYPGEDGRKSQEGREVGYKLKNTVKRVILFFSGHCNLSKGQHQSHRQYHKKEISSY